MVTIAWSPKLNTAVRAWKKRDISSIENTSKPNFALNYYGLSQNEKHAFGLIASEKPVTGGINGLWF